MLILVVYTLANIGFSYFALSIFSRSMARALPLSLQFAFGTALLSSLWIFLGLGGWLQAEILWPIVFILAIPAVWIIVQKTKILAKERFFYFQHSNRVYYGLLFIALMVMIWIGVLAYLRPPYGDAAAFYMVYPKIIAATGQLKAMPGTYRNFSTIGISGELHFAVLIILASTGVAKSFAWIVGAGMLLLLRDITRKVGGGVIAQIAAIAMLLTATTFSDFLSDGKTDLFPALIGLASVYCILLRADNRFLKGLIVIAGLNCGFSMAAKFSFIIALFPAVGLLLIFQEMTIGSGAKDSRNYKSVFLGLLLFGFSVFAGLIPHLIKNGFLFANPLAPFVGMHNWADQSSWFSFKDTLWIVATYPMALVFGVYPLQGGSMSILWIAAFALIPFMHRSEFLLRHPLMQLTLSGCFGLLCWIAVKASIFVPRYFLTTLIMLIPLPAIAVEYMWQNEIRPRLVSYAFALLTAVSLLITPFIPVTGAFTVMALRDFKHKDQRQADCRFEPSIYCKAFRSINEKASKGERVFVIGYYTYWLREDLLQCINEPWEYKVFSNPNPEEIWAAFYEQGFMHIALQNNLQDTFSDKLDPTKAPKWLRVSKEFVNTDMQIFHLKAIDPSKQPHLVCAKDGKYAWRPQAVADARDCRRVL
ncbi:hypothetical protein [Legionella lansingensis]|nr:hypothetical protein [Legionella lansingensis]